MLMLMPSLGKTAAWSLTLGVMMKTNQYVPNPSASLRAWSHWLVVLSEQLKLQQKI
jgi:hypothetical protein